MNAVYLLMVFRQTQLIVIGYQISRYAIIVIIICKQLYMFTALEDNYLV